MKRIERDIEIGNLLYKSFRGETTDDEEKLLEAWRLDPRNMAFFTRLKESDTFYEGISDMQNVDTERPFQAINNKIRRNKRVRVVRYICSAAAVLLLVVLIPLFQKIEKSEKETRPLIPRARVEPLATLVTSTGEIEYPEDSVEQLVLNAEALDPLTRTENVDDLSSVATRGIEYNVLTTSIRGNIKVTLYDGSRVWLNASSELKYPNMFVGGQRIVYLTGEAFFEVIKDTDHPFIVKTASAEINVLGTCFNVNAFEHSCVTTLVEGRVRMKNERRDSVELYPGQQVILSPEGDFSVREVDTRYCVGWMNNVFAFRETSLREIMDVLEKWYGYTCRFESPELGNVLYTTMIKKYPDIDSVLQVLVGTGDFRYIKIDDIIIIKEK